MPAHLDRRTVQRAIGAFVGAAVGDALGAPFEFGESGAYTAAFPVPVLGGRGEMTGGGGWGPGEFTDDTQMALVLAESLLASDGFDPVAVWAGWRAWAATAADVGIITRQVLGSPDPAGAAAATHARLGGRSAGNGAVMRNTPVALFTLRDDDAVAVALSGAQAALTHHDPAAHTGAVLHIAMLRAGIRGDDGFAALDAAVAALPEPERAEWSAWLAPDWTPDRATVSNGTVWGCLAEAVWSVRTSSSFAEAVVRAVDRGHDADTVACVAGSIAGARWGIQAIPSRWTTYLNGWTDTPTGRRTYDYAALLDLARALLGLTPVPLVENERAAAPAPIHPDVPLYAANWQGAVGAPTDWAVLSLCRTGGRFTEHPVRREVYLIDQYRPDDNPGLATVVADAVDTLDAFLAEAPDRPVVVHCHGGRSRTALVAKAWAMRRHGWDEATAHEWLTGAWPLADRSNDVFVSHLRGIVPVSPPQG